MLSWHRRTDSGAADLVFWASGHGFYGTGSQGAYRFSPSGAKWVSRSLADSFQIQHLAHDPAGDVLVAVGFTTPGSYGIIRSLDGGVTWSPQVSPWDNAGTYITGVAWSPSQAKFSISGYGSAVVASRTATSPDGVTWTSRTAPWGKFDQVDNGYEWIEQEGIWIAGDQFGGIWTSPDAITWTNTDTLTDPVYNFDYLDGLGIVASLNTFASGRIAHSPDAGVTWTEVNTPQSQDNWVATFNGRLYVAGHNVVSTIQSPSVYSTVDAVTFEQELLVTGLGNGQADGIAASTSRLVTVMSPGSNELVYFSSTPTAAGPIAPLWRYFIGALDGSGITDFSQLASDRVVEVILNGPLSMSGTVPSDNPQVWLPYDGDGYDDPYLAEGTRLLWGFRRESDTAPYYTVRAATIVNLIEDTAQQDDARTRFVGWDPWHYMMSRPVTDIDGNLPGPDGLSWTDTKVSVIVCELLRNTILTYGFAFIDAGDGSRIGEGSQYDDWGGSAEYAGTLEADPEIDWNIPQGTSVGQAWQDLCAAGECDIILDPIYAPEGRTVSGGPVYNFLVEISVYAQAGVTRDEQIFAWNMPGRNLVGLDRQQDGSSRANVYEAFAGQGGTGGQVTSIDSASITKYGAYVVQRFFPGAQGAAAIDAITSLAEQQIALRSHGRQTVTFTPAPERSPRPWQDYQLGDRTPTWASAQKFRQLLSGEPPSP